MWSDGMPMNWPTNMKLRIWRRPSSLAFEVRSVPAVTTKACLASSPSHTSVSPGFNRMRLELLATVRMSSSDMLPQMSLLRAGQLMHARVSRMGCDAGKLRGSVMTDALSDM
jgi:hypothetical protein